MVETHRSPSALKQETEQRTRPAPTQTGKGIEQSRKYGISSYWKRNEQSWAALTREVSLRKQHRTAEGKKSGPCWAMRALIIEKQAIWKVTKKWTIFKGKHRIKIQTRDPAYNWGQRCLPSQWNHGPKGRVQHRPQPHKRTPQDKRSRASEQTLKEGLRHKEAFLRARLRQTDRIKDPIRGQPDKARKHPSQD